MMAAYKFLSKPMQLDGGICCLVIENKDLFRKTWSDLFKGRGAEWLIVSENYEPFAFEKAVAVFENILDLSGMDKKLMTKTYPKLEQTANDLFYEDLADLRQRLFMLGEKLSFEYDLDYSFNDNIAAMDILKLLSFNIRKDADNDMENMVLYMKMLRKYMGIKLFIIGNLWFYYTSEECAVLNRTLLSAGINVLDIENIMIEDMKKHNVYVIDNDLCEIVDNSL